MNRRKLLAHAGILPLLPLVRAPLTARALGAEAVSGSTMRRVRPSDPDWPNAASWEKFKEAVGGRLMKVEPLFASCENGAAAFCNDVLAALKNPYYVGDQPAGTQTVGWVDAWTSAPSAYAVAAKRRHA
jgi:hypothetical protein